MRASAALGGALCSLTFPSTGSCAVRSGTIVQQFNDGAYEVEFSDHDGRTYAELALGADALSVLE